MAINRKTFFDAARKGTFRGALTQDQVEGCEAILREWERRGLVDLRWLAYMLATAYHETAHTMQPIREIGRGKGRRYGTPSANGQTYYGRGYVQLTWDYNYRVMGDILSVDLVNKPDLALDHKVAAAIMFEGMIRGTFTGRDLADYFKPAQTDWIGARRIINGTDKAELIAGYAKQFHAALLAASNAMVASPIPDVPPVETKPASNWLSALLSLFKRKA